MVVTFARHKVCCDCLYSENVSREVISFGRGQPLVSLLQEAVPKQIHRRLLCCCFTRGENGGTVQNHVSIPIKTILRPPIGPITYIFPFLSYVCVRVCVRVCACACACACVCVYMHILHTFRIHLSVISYLLGGRQNHMSAPTQIPGWPLPHSPTPHPPPVHVSILRERQQ